jgi:hypothetical protein
MAIEATSARQDRVHVGVAPEAAIGLLRRWLSRTLAPDAINWLDGEIERQRTAADERRLAIAIGSAKRRVGRADLTLSAEDLDAADVLRPGWKPRLWATDEAARVTLVLATHRGDDQAFADRVDRLCATGELTECVACLKGFAVFPAATRLHPRAREAVRSSTQAVFQAIACDNPYPRDHFDQAAWNQMVVKCVFNELPIGAIVGLRERRNAELTQMLRDFIAERHAAGRPVAEAVHAFIAP